MTARKLGHCLVSFVALVAVAVPTSASATLIPDPTVNVDRDAVGCRFSPGTATLTVLLRSSRAAIEIGGPKHRHRAVVHVPAVATIEREDQAVAVRRGVAGSAVGCEGPPPTVTTVDSIEVLPGRHSVVAGGLVIDLTHGPLAPGATAEAAGASGIEVDVASPAVFLLRMTRGADSLAVTSGAAGSLIDLNGPVAPGGEDLTVGPGPLSIVDGGGAGDQLQAQALDGSAFGSPALLLGGQGQDAIFGHTGTQFISTGPGRDRVIAGAGADEILNDGSAPDKVDCGPGTRDRFIGSGRLRGCEKVEPLEGGLARLQPLDYFEAFLVSLVLPPRVAETRAQGDFRSFSSLADRLVRSAH